jgi:hypothetical protein
LGRIAYVVFALGGNGIDEVLLVEVVGARLLVLLRVLQKGSARQLRELGLVGGAEQDLAHLLGNGGHGEMGTAARRAAGAIGIEGREGAPREMQKWWEERAGRARGESANAPG